MNVGDNVAVSSMTVSAIHITVQGATILLRKYDVVTAKRYCQPSDSGSCYCMHYPERVVKVNRYSVILLYTERSSQSIITACNQTLTCTCCRGPKQAFRGPAIQGPQGVCHADDLSRGGHHCGRGNRKYGSAHDLRTGAFLGYFVTN